MNCYLIDAFLCSRLDYEGFLIASLICKGRPRHFLDKIMAIKAFDAETATISHSVKTPEAAAIRYEFWRIGLRKIKCKESGKRKFVGRLRFILQLMDIPF